jgi:predicted aspartyl protease
MSLFKVNVVAVNPRETERETRPVEVLVDTGSELTWLPKDVLAQAGIKPVRKRAFLAATTQTIQRDIGYAILRSNGFETNDEVVFAEPNDMNLLGVRTIEGFGVAVDNIGHRFMAQATLVV